MLDIFKTAGSDLERTPSERDLLRLRGDPVGKGGRTDIVAEPSHANKGNEAVLTVPSPGTSVTGTSANAYKGISMAAKKNVDRPGRTAVRRTVVGGNERIT